MADKGNVQRLLNALPDNIRYPLQEAFNYVMDNWKLGTGQKGINARWYRLEGTTHTTANTEFSIKHGVDGIPTQLFPVLDLSVVNSQIVNLSVSKAADNDRIYLKSTSTNASFAVFVEL